MHVFLKNFLHVFKWIYMPIFLVYSYFYIFYFKGYIDLFIYIICSYANLIKTCVIHVQFLSYTCSSCYTCFISFVYSFYIWLYIICPSFDDSCMII